MKVVVIKGLIPSNVRQCPLLDIKVFSLTLSHHEHREAKKIVKEAKSYFSLLSNNQSTLENSLSAKKNTHCL